MLQLVMLTFPKPSHLDKLDVLTGERDNQNSNLDAKRRKNNTNQTTSSTCSLGETRPPRINAPGVKTTPPMPVEFGTLEITFAHFPH